MTNGNVAVLKGPEISPQIARTFEVQERKGLYLAVRARTFALVAIALLIAFVTPYPGYLHYHALIACFILSGFAQLWAGKQSWSRFWHLYVLTAFEFGLLAFTLLYPNPFSPIEHAPQLALRFGNFIYFFVMLAGLAFSYRPRLVLWGGFCGAVSWAAAVGMMAMLPDSIVIRANSNDATDVFTTFMLPTYVDLGIALQEIVVFLITAVLLATIVERSRRLVQTQATLERDRSNLARYFPPATVERLAESDGALSQIREQNAAVLFADLVSFTGWAEQHSPTEVIEVLRDVHSQMEQEVFAHGGTLDKFIGDGMMATFGTLEPGPRDPGNAMACATAILNRLEAWNKAREAAGEVPLQVSVGVHFGPVVVGEIGTDRRMELAVLGDTVNVASRLETMTRALGCRAIVSDAAMTAAQNSSSGAEDVAGFKRGGEQTLKGRTAPIEVWTAA